MFMLKMYKAPYIYFEPDILNTDVSTFITVNLFKMFCYGCQADDGKVQLKEYFANGIMKLQEKWDKYINVRGYVEK